MNEIERAIEYLAPITEHPTMTGEYCKNLKVAIKALREKAERERGCSFCDEDSDEHDYMNGVQTIDGGKYLVLETDEWDEYNGCYDDVRIIVSFCPQCGKRLEEHHESD